MANNELRNNSRDISTTLGAVPRTSLLKQLHEIESAIYEKTGASYFRLLSEFSGSVQDILSLSGVFRDDVTAAEDAPALCELWRPSFDWLTDEMIYTYPIGDEITTSWFDPLIDWTITNVAANMDHGRVLVGRKEFKEQLAISVSASRAASRHSSTPSADDIESPTLSAYSSLPSSHGPKASQSGTSSLGSAIPYDELKKKIKCIVGDPPSADHIFTGASSDNYLQWRVTILETLADADEAPNKVLAEAVISCLKGSIKAFIKRQVSRQSMVDEGAMAVISVLDKRFRTSLALKALDAKFDGLHQGQGESVLQYSIKFEEILHIKQSTSPDEVLKDSTIIRCFNRGLRDSRAILMSALVDPLKTMDFITYKDSLVSICDDIPQTIASDVNNTLSGNSGRQRSQQSGKSPKQLSDADVVAICVSAATDLGLSKDACLRCGQSGHFAANCRADSSSIIRVDERCRRCGCIKKPDHKCNSKAFVCARCKRRHHLAGICLKTITPTSTATAAPADESDLKVVRTAAVNVRAANSSTVASLLDGVSEDPTITLRIGKDPDAEYCETLALVDTGANLSLMDQSVCDFLHRNGLVDGNSFSGLVSPAQVTFGNHTVVQTKTVLRINCRLADHQCQDNANTATLVFLLVPLCNPRVIIGRNMFGRLGIRLKSDKVPLPPYPPLQSAATQTSNDVPVTSAEVSSPSSSAIISAHCCRASSSPTTPLIERIVEDGQHRLLARLPPVENALIYPYRASKRRRPPVDDAIIHEKLSQMCRLGKAAKSADKDVIVVCQPVLIDKWDSSSGTSEPRTHPIDEAELKSRYRLTIDSRPLNNLKLQRDSSHKYFYVPTEPTPQDGCAKGNEEHVYKQYQRGATVLLRDIPGSHLGFWSKVDLEDAYGTLRVPDQLSRLFGTVSTCPNTGRQCVWSLRTLAQGWRWAPLIFQVAMTTIIEEDINPALAAAGLKATVIHVQDDVLISSSDIETGHKAWVIVSDILHRKGGFIVNGSKSQPPSRTASFCGLQLEGRTYKPTPSRREFTEATYNIALRDFIDCNPAKPKRGKKRPISTGDVIRDRRLQWLRSWCGVFNYLAGHLSPEAQSALNQLYTVTKVYQDNGSSAEDIDSTVPIVSSAFRILTDFYLSGVIPCAIGNDGIATLVVTDANADSYGGILLRVLKVGPGGRQFAAATKAVLKHIPDLSKLLDEDEDTLAVVPLKTCGARWSRTESSRSSTWRERAALLNVVHSCQALLFGKCIAIVDNINAQRVWNDLEAEFSVGKYLTRWQTCQRYIHAFAWFPRDTLPSVADAIARSIATDVKAATCNPSNSADPDYTQPICAAAEAGDSPQFDPLYLPGEDLRCVFRAWRDMAQSKKFKTYDDDFDSLQWLAEAQAECPHLQHLRQVNPAKYQLNDAGLLHVNDRYMVPKCYSRDVVRRVHESYAHCGIAQCISIISSIFYVIGLAAAVSKVLSRCKCFFIRAVRLHRPPSGTLKRRREVMELIYIDIVGPLPVGHLGGNRFRYILTWICAGSHFLGAIPLVQATAEAISNALERNVIDVFGRVKEIAADNASQFRCASFVAWCQSLDIRCWHIPVAAPWRNALLERQHKSLKSSLKILVGSVEHRWPRFLSKATLRCNHRDLGGGITPAMLMFGHDRSTLWRFSPPSLATAASSLNDAVRAIADIRNKHLTTLFEEDVTLEPVSAANLSRRHQRFKIGDSVLRWSNAATGLKPNWKGPFKVTATPGNFTVLLSDGSLQDTRNERRYLGEERL